MAAKKTLSRAHSMPFGAEVTPEGVRFRLWAPAASTVELIVQRKPLPMQKQDEGWFERLEPSARPGSLYRYRINGEHLVPDPASRFQPRDVDGPSEVIAPREFNWNDNLWLGRRWNEAVIYELHVGAFTRSGTYAGVASKLEHLKKAGITAIELMPLADFSGRRNWGYDGVLPYAPDSRYGRPEDLKSLIEAAHHAGLMVMLDVVYNHFGPRGNYLHQYAPQFFTERHKTPWGAAINFDGQQSRWVREYFAHNALYWLEEYGFDGLRFDAVHAIFDDSPRHILEEIADRVPNGKHLVLENDANQARFLASYTAQWNDDSHHAFHVLATGEKDGYYIDYADAPAKHLARCLAEGFAYQSDFSKFRNQPRGAASAHLPPTSFVDFLQNHDQIGNRAFGERLTTLADSKILRALVAMHLLAPSPPLLFMGEEWACKQPFLFFCDFPGELGEAVRKGRREEFARFRAFEDPAARERIPDPLAEQTFKACVLDWKALDRSWLKHYEELLALRQREIVPRLGGMKSGRYRMLTERAFEVTWGDLGLTANCGEQAIAAEVPGGARTLWGSPPNPTLQPWSVYWWMAP